MRITEGQLRRVVRGIIHEDLQSFIDAATAADINYNASPGDPLLVHPRNKGVKRQARTLKDLWRQHSDQSSFKGLTFVHWFSSEAVIPEFVHAGGRDELSTSISAPDRPIDFTRWGLIGIQVRGWVTFAGNNMNQMMTGYMDKVKAKDRVRYGKAGLPKRPLETIPSSWESFALEAGDLHFDPSQTNEAIVDNWRPVAWVVSGGIRDFFESKRRRGEREALLTMIETMKDSGLPIIDLDREKIEITDLERLYDETG